MNLHVAHVTSVHSISDNRITRKECRASVRKGHRVSWVGPGKQSELDHGGEPGVTVVRTKFANGRLRRAIFGSARILRELRSLEPDIVHGHDPELLPALVLYRALNPRAVVVYDAHEKLAGQIAGKPYVPRQLVPIVSKLSGAAIEVLTGKIDGVVCATVPIEATIRNPRTCVVQNFPWSEPGGSFSKELSWAERPKVACYVGGLTEERGLSNMISAVRISKSIDRLLLAGPASTEAMNVIENNADFVDYRGRVDPNLVPSLIGECFVGLAMLQPVPNYVDSQPTKVFEYMANGIPFIASDFDYWKSLFGTYDCGLFVRPQDPEKLASAMDQLALNYEAAGEMGERGQRAFRDHFTFDGQAELLNEFYTMLVDAKS